MRADMFRYLILLRYGGIYTDVDTECMVPLDDYIRATDRMIVSEERNFDTLKEFEESAYVRQHQILQWTLVAAPDHPMLYSLVNSIVRKTRKVFYMEYSYGLVQLPRPPRYLFDNPKTLMDHTGPGIFTDETFACLEAFGEGFMTILPEEGFGIRPWVKEHEHFHPFVIHHFHGSWKPKSKAKVLREEINEAWVYSLHALGETGAMMKDWCDNLAVSVWSFIDHHKAHYSDEDVLFLGRIIRILYLAIIPCSIIAALAGLTLVIILR